MRDGENERIIDFASRSATTEEERAFTNRDVAAIHTHTDRILGGKARDGFRMDTREIKTVSFPGNRALFLLTKRDDIVAFLLRSRDGTEVIARLEGRNSTVLLTEIDHRNRELGDIEQAGDSNADRVYIMASILEDVARIRANGG